MNDFDQDVSAGRVYLGGYIAEDEKGVPRQRDYKEGSENSNYCRAALARVLRSDKPLEGQLRKMLADMFEPMPGPTSPFSARILYAKNRSSRRPKDHIARTHKVQFVRDLVDGGEGVESSILKAVAHFGVSREHMYDLWKDYRRLFAAIDADIQSRRISKE